MRPTMNEIVEALRLRLERPGDAELPRWEVPIVTRDSGVLPAWGPVHLNEEARRLAEELGVMPRGLP